METTASFIKTIEGGRNTSRIRMPQTHLPASNRLMNDKSYFNSN